MSELKDRYDNRLNTEFKRIRNKTGAKSFFSWLPPSGGYIAEDGYQDVSIADWVSGVLRRMAGRFAVSTNVANSDVGVACIPAVGDGQIYRPMVVTTRLDEDGNATLFNDANPLPGDCAIVDFKLLLDTSGSDVESETLTLRTGDFDAAEITTSDSITSAGTLEYCDTINGYLEVDKDVTLVGSDAALEGSYATLILIRLEADHDHEQRVEATTTGEEATTTGEEATTVE